MEKLKLHWTETNVAAFVHRLSFDFITQIQKRLEENHIARRDFAGRLGVTRGRVSQLFNDPGNMTLESAVECARTVGMKVALIAYDDNDPKNNSGPVNGEMFSRCWRLQGAPRDFLDLELVSTTQLSLQFPPIERTSAVTVETHAPYVSFENFERHAGTYTNSIGLVQ